MQQKYLTMIPQWSRNKKILLGISGGIAAYKTPELVRAWVKLGYEVETILTSSASKLVSALAVSTLSGRRVWTDDDFLSTENGWRIPHISLSAWADVMVVAPCTANALRAAATGDSSTLLGAAMLASPAPLLLFPAMNTHMWGNKSTQQNARIAAENGIHIVNPDYGSLACGYEGKGRLPSTDVILEETWRVLCDRKDFAGKRLLITAGPTHEYIDPVRFIGNPSSGKMGYALAAEAYYRGAEVVLVSGPSSLRTPSGIRTRFVTGAEEMLRACLEELPQADIVIKSAAVGDYRVKERSSFKIKRAGRETLLLELVQNPDIAHEISMKKRDEQLLVGFAAETDNIEENALAKIKSKNLDMIAANDVSESGAGFSSDTNRVRIYFSDKYDNRTSAEISGSKWEVASGILDQIAQIAGHIK